MNAPLSKVEAFAVGLLAGRRTLPVAALLLAVLVYGPHLANAFVWDDLGFLVQNPTVNGSGSWTAALTKDAWWALSRDVGSRALYYRPLFVLLSRLLWWIGGGSPLPFHAAALLMHVLAALLGARLLSAQGLSRGAAAAAALLFIVHPLGGEVVYWASAIGEAALLVAALGALLALRGAREAPTPARRRWLQALAAGCALAAVGVKETGVVVPALAAADALLATDRPRLQRLAGTWPVWLALLPWVAARALLLEGSGASLALDAPASRIAWAGEVLAWDLRRLIAPLPLSPAHDFPREVALGPGLLALGGLAVGWALLAWRRPRAGVGVLFVLLPLLPPLAQGFMTLRSGMPVAERYLYLSLLPILAALALGARALWRRAGWPDGALGAAAAVLALISGGISHANGRHYDGNGAYAARILAVYPTNPLALALRGQAALSRGDPAGALRDFEAAVRGEPNRALAHLNVAVARERLGDLRGAEAAARAALLRDERLAAGHAVLARLLRDQGRIADAGPHYRAAARLAPEDPGARADFGTWLFIQGDVASASAEWEQGLAHAPEHCELLFNVAMARIALGRAAEARAAAASFLDRCREGYGPQRSQAAAWAGR